MGLVVACHSLRHPLDALRLGGIRARAVSTPLDRSVRGLLTAVTGDGYEKTISYRADGSERSHSVSVKGWRPVRTDVTYLDNGSVRDRTTTVYDGAGTVVAHDTEANSVDTHGRLVATKRDGQPFASYAYDVQGQPLWATYSGPLAGGEVVTLTHDPLTHARVGVNQNSTAWAAAVSRRTNARGLVDSEEISVSTTSRHRAFQYTSQGYLKQSTDADATYSYEYEANGLPSRIVSTLSGTSDDRVFGRAGATLTAGSHHHTFDDLGRAIERDDVHMSYGPNGQVAAATRGPMAWQYLYDERGSRIAKLDASGAVQTLYLGDGTVIDGSSITAPVRYAGNVVGVLETTLGTAPTKKFQLVATDMIGSALGDTDGTARIPSPFGDRAAHPDLAAAVDYAAKGWDADLGIVRMGVRDYDPALGRFTTADPLFLEEPQRCVASPVECNLYGYARNQPLTNTDPSGMCVDACAIEIAAIAGAATVVTALSIYASQPANQKNFSHALDQGWDAVVVRADVAKKLVESAWGTSKAESLQNRFGRDIVYVFATYKVQLAGGAMYSGRTAGIANEGESPEDAAKRLVDERWRGHGRRYDPESPTAADKAGPDGAPELDAFTSGKLSKRPTAKELADLVINYGAIRGREQQSIDHFGGARSEGGSSGNAINGVRRDNVLRVPFDGLGHGMLDKKFGALPPTWTPQK